jgi:hypothetical protein
MFTVRSPVRGLAVNANDTNFPTVLASTTTEPTGAGVFTFRKGAGGAAPDDEIVVPKWMKIWAFGAGSNNDAFSVRVWGWHKVGSGPIPNTLWLPSIIGEFAFILSNAVGVAGSPVLDTERLADTVTPVAARLLDRDIAAGTAVNSDYFIVSPATDSPTFIMMKTFGCQKFTFHFDQTTGTPTMNVLVAGMDDVEE